MSICFCNDKYLVKLPLGNWRNWNQWFIKNLVVVVSYFSIVLSYLGCQMPINCSCFFFQKTTFHGNSCIQIYVDLDNHFSLKKEVIVSGSVKTSKYMLYHATETKNLFCCGFFINTNFCMICKCCQTLIVWTFCFGFE